MGMAMPTVTVADAVIITVGAEGAVIITAGTGAAVTTSGAGVQLRSIRASAMLDLLGRYAAAVKRRVAPFQGRGRFGRYRFSGCCQPRSISTAIRIRSEWFFAPSFCLSSEVVLATVL